MPGYARDNGGSKGIQLSSDPVRDLKQGKTVVRNIDWVPGGGTVTAAGSDAFAGAMGKIAAAMKQVGGSYSVELYMDPQSGDIVVRKLGPLRLATVQASLVKAGAGGNGPQVGQAKKDGEPRLEIVRLP
jgi:hypothetical protein